MSTLVERDSPQLRISEPQDESTRERELEREIQKLREQNKQLQLRILGVNELARLLQDRNEVVQVFQEKNKRLEVAVVRLENRCSNFERKLKMQGGVGGPKPGQSPFIPGPSRQILEALMKENSELKKTLNNVTKKGASGYLEAVKATQLEDVIDQQKQEIGFLRSQIQSLTSGGIFEDEKSTSTQSTPLSSMSSSADTGHLKRQMIKMQHAMKVKDRFCTLLSQQVAELQEKLKTSQRQEFTDTPEEKSSSSESNSRQPVQETKEHAEVPYATKQPTDVPTLSEIRANLEGELKEQLRELEAKHKYLMEQSRETLQKEREERMSLLDKMQAVERELSASKSELDIFQKRCEDLTAYNQTLLVEKSELTKMMADRERQMEGSSNEARIRELEKANTQLQQTLNDQIAFHSEAMEKREKDHRQLQMVLEEANLQRAMAESKLSTKDNETMQKISSLQEQIEELSDSVAALDSQNRDLRELNSQLQQENKNFKANLKFASPGYGASLHNQPFSQSYGGRTFAPSYGSSARSALSYQCGEPTLILPPNTRGVEMVRDGGKIKPTTAPHSTPSLDPTISSKYYGPQLGDRCGGNAVDKMPFRQEVTVRSRDSDDTPPAKPPGTLSLGSPSHRAPGRSHTSPVPSPSPIPTPSPSSSSLGRTPTMPIVTRTSPQMQHRPQSTSPIPPHSAYTTAYSTRPTTSYTSPQRTPLTSAYPYYHPGSVAMQYSQTGQYSQPGQYIQTGQYSQTSQSGYQHAQAYTQRPFQHQSSVIESGYNSLSSFPSSGLPSNQLSGQYPDPRLYERHPSSPHDYQRYQH